MDRNMTEEQAWFILEHGSTQGLPEYFKAIKTIKKEFDFLKEHEHEVCVNCPYDGNDYGVEPTHRKVNGEGRLFCGNCGTIIPRWGKYCSECGRKVIRE